MRKSLLTLLFLSLFVTIFAQPKAENKTDEKGLKQGAWVKLDEKTGKKIYQGTFKDGKPQGKFIYYYPNGDSIHSIMYFIKDGAVAYCTMKHENGKLQAKGKYIGEKKDSVWNFYDEEALLLSTDVYKDGKKNGVSKVYFQDGNVAEERSYKNDVYDGKFTIYHTNKKVRGTGTYKNGILTGLNAYYYPNGVAAAIGLYDDVGKKKGVWLYKDDKGNIKSKEVYVDGEQLSDKEAAI